MYHRYLQNLLSFLFFTLLFFFPSCNSGGQTQNQKLLPTEEHLPTRRELNSTFRKKRAITLVYPSDEKYETFYKGKIELLNKNENFGLEVTGIKETDFKKEHWTNEILFIIGSIATNPILKELQESLPVKLKEKSFYFDGKEYIKNDAIFRLFPYPNPHNQSLPLYLITGNSDEEIFKFLKEEYTPNWAWALWSSWGYEVFEDGERKVSGNLSETKWELDKRVHFDFTGQNDTILQSEHFRFIAHNSTLSKEEVNNIFKQCEKIYISIINFIEKKANLPKIDYHIYPSVEIKGLQRASMIEATANIQENRIEVVMNDNFQGSNLHQENNLVLRKMLGKPHLVALEEGLSNHFTPNWQKKGYQYWCGKLFRSDNLPPLVELLDNEFYEKESYLVLGAMAGVFTDFLIKNFGKKAFLNNYKNWTAKELLELEKEWKEYLISQYPYQSQKNIIVKEALPYLQGFNFAHEGYMIYNGYGSKLAKESIQRLEEIGTSAVAIIPYSYMRNPQSPDYIPIVQGTGGENDQAVLFSHFEAQKMGMHTMLKPQIWVREGWPGDIEMHNEKDWKVFFENYYRWVRHYALLAEINGFDSYCIGVEFAKATLAKEQEWRKIIRKLRGIYSGQITYAANWGEEFENVKFWDELDFIGLNCYYPLSKKDKPSKRELSNEFNKTLIKVEQVCKKYNKQLVFTEIGFRSVEGTWKNPHAEAAGRDFNDQTQQLCYEVVFEGIKNKKWCNGILWWKWPCNLSHRKSQNKGFTPSQKETEYIVNKYFKTKNR